MSDPTKTTGLRRSFYAEGNRRLARLRSQTHAILVEHDLMAAKNSPLAQFLPNPGDRLSAFVEWFENAANFWLRSEDWWSRFLRRAYESGVVAGGELVGNPHAAPLPVPAVYRELAAREFAGIVASMTQQVARRAGNAALGQLRPTQVYKEVLTVLAKTAPVRLKAAVNTMTVQLHNAGRLAQFRAAGITQVGIEPERLEPLRTSRFAKLDHAHDHNECHEPGGSPKGGQFCSTGGGGPYTRAQLERMDIDELDMMAFGHKPGDIVRLDPSEINIQYPGDLANPEDKFAKGGMDWARSVDLSQPVDVEIHQDGKFYLADGHHRWFAAKKTGRSLTAKIEVKAKPIEKILGTELHAKLVRHQRDSVYRDLTAAQELRRFETQAERRRQEAEARAIASELELERERAELARLVAQQVEEGRILQQSREVAQAELEAARAAARAEVAAARAATAEQEREAAAQWERVKAARAAERKALYPQRRPEEGPPQKVPEWKPPPGVERAGQVTVGVPPIPPRLAELGEFVNALTAGDDRVCVYCEELSANGPYSIEEAQGLLPLHVNCRCAWIPAFDMRYQLNRELAAGIEE